MKRTFLPQLPLPPIACEVTFQPALTRPDADMEFFLVRRDSQAEILSQIQTWVSKADRPFTQITLRFQ